MILRKYRADQLVKKAESINEYFSNALELTAKESVQEAFTKALPWAEVILGETAEAIPIVKTLVKIAKELTKEKDPFKLCFTAATVAFQKAASDAFREIGNPAAGVSQSVKQAKDQIEAIDFSEVKMDSFDKTKPFEHDFYKKAMTCLEVAAIQVGYAKSDIDKIKSKVNANFSNIFSELLIEDEFQPYVKYLNTDNLEKRRAQKLLADHSNYHQWLFEDAPVLRISPFALQHVYIETDCSQAVWEEIKKDRNPFDIKTEDRRSLLKTVVNLIKEKDLNAPIIIQGIAGSGKSAFTLRLFNELLEKHLHPICIRIGDLDFSTHIKDALPKAVRLAEPDDINPVNTDDIFLNDDIFDEPGVGEFAHISKHVLILDGWDEISQSDRGFKQKVAQLLTQLNDHYLSNNRRPRVRVILTGRPTVDIGDTNCVREKSPYLTVLKFTPEQLRQYVEKIIAAVRSTEVLVDKTELTENWKDLDIERFFDVFQKYEKEFDEKTETSLDILGSPLLAYLTVKLVSEWNGDVTYLLQNRTTLYRHLIDLTCEKAARPDFDDQPADQYKLYDDELRERLRQTASAVTIWGSENIPKKELAARLELDEESLTEQSVEMQKDNILSRLLISFYFKSAPHLGCEFAHKSFREYFFAEDIIEALKEYGRNQTHTPPPRAQYWKDFSDEHNDHRYRLSRSLGELLSAQWLTPEVKDHLRELLFWEIKRTLKPEGKKTVGTPTNPLNIDQWVQVRTALADLWEWWGEGTHLRLQPVWIKGEKDFEPEYVRELIKLAAPRTKSSVYLRSTTIDSHLGDGLFELTAIVHYLLVRFSAAQTDRKYQSTDGPTLRFKPSGEREQYFLNYVGRINACGWNPRILFPHRSFMKQIDFSGARLIGLFFVITDLSGADLSGADLSGAFLPGANLSGANLSRANLSGADLSHARLSGADLSGAILSHARLLGAGLSGAILSHARLSGADLSDAFLSGAFLSDADLSGAFLPGADLSGANLSRAYLSGADLSGAIISLESLDAFYKQIRQAKFDFLFVDGEKMSREEIETLYRQRVSTS